jgi:hypothetical protein
MKRNQPFSAIISGRNMFFRSIGSTTLSGGAQTEPSRLQIAVFSGKRLENRLSWIYILFALI